MRMTDQAAAEALVSVGRVGAGGSSSAPGEESDGLDLDTSEGDQPKKKKAKRSKDDGSAGGQHHWIGEGAGGGSSPEHHLHRPGSIPPMQFIHPSLRPGAPGFAHTGGMLPGINSMDIAHGGAGGDPTKAGGPHGVMFIPGGPGVPGTAGAGGFVRAGSGSRSHSPLSSPQHAALHPPAGTLILPAPHGPGGILQPLEVPGSGGGHVMVNVVGPGVYAVIPSLGDLERHYAELGDQKKRMEEMLDRTERMMQGLKRGMEDLRGASVPPPPPPSSSSAPAGAGSRPPSTAPPATAAAPGSGPAPSPAPSVPLQRPSSSGGSGEKERRESVWAVVDPSIRGE
ncbi:hypothetical protein GYMLUDRAFT_416231 [Collybiopsis luxurians FD-317 M1]|nr:hypothetical protein GYMLUDRAFT_416231 [Collybiopsis luxurians FD-317 M1]